MKKLKINLSSVLLLFFFMSACSHNQKKHEAEKVTYKPKYSYSFRSFDVNKDDRVSRSEWKNHLHNLLGTMDRDQDGDFEFSDEVRKPLAWLIKYDKDSSGNITKEELDRALDIYYDKGLQGEKDLSLSQFNSIKLLDSGRKRKVK
jgi:Ca2+-binding EF-hand superfamily protein